MRSLFAAALAALLCGLLACPALAQQDDGSPPLPDIAPREVEIRGRLDISFPALRRPDLAGLLPPVSAAPLPPLAPAPLEATAPPVAAPQALAASEVTGSGFAPLPPPERGLLEAGAGRYLSRFGAGRLDLALAPRWDLRTRLDYHGTDGFAPFDERDVETPADDLRGAATLRTEQDAFTAALSADGFFARQNLYGAERSPVAGTQQATAPERDAAGGGIGVALETGGRVPLEARARYDAARVATDVFEGAAVGFEREEQRFAGRLAARASVSGMQAEADVRGSTAQLSGGARSSMFDGAASFVDGGAGVWVIQEAPYRVFAGARVLTFSGEDDDGTFVVPDVRAEWQAAPDLTVYAHTQPRAEANRLAERYRENPSLLYEDAPQPAVFTFDAEGGLRFYPAEGLEVNALAGYRHAPSFLFYEGAAALEAPLYARGITGARYGEARIVRAGGSLSYRHAERFHASLSAQYRSGTLAEDDAAIPYFSPLVAQALFAYDFGDGRVALTGSLESTRPVTRADDAAEVGTFADLDVEGSYALTPGIGLVVRLQNLSPGALERYDRYPRPPLVIESGLRVRL